MSMSKPLSKVVLLSALVVGMGLTACASKPAQSEKTLDEKVQAQPPANKPEDLYAKAATSFANTPGLTEEQKKSLTDIYQKIYSESTALRKEIGQSKSLMFDMLASKDYKSKDVDVLKKKIVQLNQKRMDLMFQALADVQKIVGYGKGKEEIYRHLRDYDLPQGQLSRFH